MEPLRTLVYGLQLFLAKRPLWTYHRSRLALLWDSLYEVPTHTQAFHGLLIDSLLKQAVSAPENCAGNRLSLSSLVAKPYEQGCQTAYVPDTC